MMTSSSDYVYMTPDSSVITGDIIPKEDVDGRPPLMRIENAYYLLEMYYDFIREDRSVTVAPDDRMRHMLFYDIEDLFTDWETAEGVANHQDATGSYRTVWFKDLPSAGVEHIITSTNATSLSDFVKWIAQNCPQYLLTMPRVHDELDLWMELKADTIRKMFWGFNQPCYEPFNGSSYVTPEKYVYSVPSGQTITYKRYSYDNTSRTLVVEDVVEDIGSGGGYMYSAYAGAIQLVRKRDYGIHEYRYRLMNGFPKNDVYATAKFNSSMVIESAFTVTNHCFWCDYPNAIRKLLILEPMERISDTEFRVKMFRPSIMKRLTDSLGVQWEDDPDFIRTSFQVPNGYGQVWHDGYIWAKVGNKYTALPADWDWSPGQSQT